MEKHTDDILLLQLIKAGDEQAFKYLFERYFVSLCRFIHLYISEPKVAEDIVLDIFTGLWEKRQTWEIRISIQAYLFQSARNRALNYLRDHERFVPTGDFSSLEPVETDDALEIRELQRLIEEAICSLPPTCRDIFRKSRQQNLSNKEIAARLQITVKAVEAQITRALKQIRRYLGDTYTYLW